MFRESSGGCLAYKGSSLQNKCFLGKESVVQTFNRRSIVQFLSLANDIMRRQKTFASRLTALVLRHHVKCFVLFNSVFRVLRSRSFGIFWSKQNSREAHCCVIFPDNGTVEDIVFSDSTHRGHSAITVSMSHRVLVFSKQPEIGQWGPADAQRWSAQAHTAEAGLATGAHAGHSHRPTAWWENQRRARRAQALAVRCG